LAALHAHASFFIRNFGKGVLIGRGNNCHRTDYRADPASSTEILINDYGFHQIPSFVVTFFGYVTSSQA
jgi:hypothetical protein